MIRIKPFTGYRPHHLLVEKVAALPYDIVSDEEARALIKNNPYSFLNVDKQELHMKPNETKVKIYQGAEEYLKKFIDNEILISDQEESIYIYGMESGGRIYYGIIACLHCEDYKLGRIKCHEQLRKEKKKDRMTYISSCKYQAAPIMVMHRETKEIQMWIMKHVTNDKPLYDFKDEIGVRNTIFRISHKEEIEYIIKVFKNVEVVYLADGHHRTEAQTQYAQHKQHDNLICAGDRGYNYLLGVIFGKEQVVIRSYNRIIKNVSGLSEKEIFDKMNQNFEIHKTNQLEYVPNQKNVFGMRYERVWYSLELREEKRKQLDEIQRLDVNILQDFILGPIFNIKDPTENSNIEFISASRGSKELNRRTDDDMDVAFSLFATDIDEFMKVIDLGGLMPPKSTWFEPKIRRGLFVYEMK